MVVLDWLAKMLDLPDCFFHSSQGQGGGVIQVRLGYRYIKGNRGVTHIMCSITII